MSLPPGHIVCDITPTLPPRENQMKENGPGSSTEIRNAVKAVRNRRPSFAPILDFYEEVFIAQEDSKSGVRIDQIEIPQNNLAAKGKKGILPLIKISEFAIDVGASKKLFEKLLHSAAASHPDMALSAQTLTQALGTEKYDLDKFFSNYLEENEEYFQQIKKNYRSTGVVCCSLFTRA